ncbi:MAG: hypothetical protein E7365_06400 [Clostridiales bacterium]|nr:hypothetical protein [Clostridiales bacterium]
MKTKKTEKLILCAISVFVVTILTIIIFNARQNYLYTNRDRLIIFAYQTNISGSDAEEWSKKLKQSFDDVPDFEVSVFQTKEAGNESITITSEKGWSQIVVRLAAGDGDILFVNNEIFYNVLIKENLLLPIEHKFAKPVTDDSGVVYGIDITKATPDGLLNLGTSEYVGKGQPLPIISVDEKDFEFNGYSYKPRVIAVIYKGAKYADKAQTVLYNLFGGAENE